MPVGHMLKSMTSGELVEWAIYFKIKNSEPKNKKSVKEILGGWFSGRIKKKAK